MSLGVNVAGEVYLRFTYLRNSATAALVRRRQDGNATKMYLEVLWHFQRHPKLLRTFASIATL